MIKPFSNAPDWSDKVILIADDEVTNLHVLSTSLKRTKAKILSGSDGQEAIDLFAQNKDIIDIVLLDIKMPQKDGFEVLNFIRQTKPDTIVVAQTAYALVDEERKIRQLGFDDYLSKPILISKLFMHLEKYLQ